MATNYIFNFYIYDEDGNGELLVDEKRYFLSYKRAIRFIYKKIKSDLIDCDPDFTNFTDSNELLQNLMSNKVIRLQHDDIVYNYQLLGA